MTIDKQRLATDPGYWDGLGVPKDAQEYGPSNGYFYKKENGVWFYWKSSLNNPWDECSTGEPLTGYRISRPQKPEVEWGVGLPKTNTDCEMADAEGVFVEVRIVSRVDGYAIGWCPEREMVYFSRDPEDFRRIRTNEQRKRDELVELMEAERENYFPKAVTAEEIADAILSRYNLEPKDV